MVILGKMAKTRVHDKTSRDKTEIKPLKIRKGVGRNLRSRMMEKNLRMNLHRNTMKMVGPDNSQNLTKFAVTLEEKIRTIISIHLRITSNRTGSQRNKIKGKCSLAP